MIVFVVIKINTLSGAVQVDGVYKDLFVANDRVTELKNYSDYFAYMIQQEVK